MSRFPYKQCNAAKPGPEQALVRHVSRWLEKSVPSSAVWIGLDMPVGSGIPDIVAFCSDARISPTFRPHELDSAILAFVREKSSARCSAVMRQFASIDAEYLISRIECLAVNGLLETSEDPIMLNKSYNGITQQVVTVEVKISNWKIALKQAKRNQLFSTRAFVALPQQTACRIAKSKEFTDLTSIGILSVDDDGEVDCIHSGRTLEPVLWSYFYSIMLTAVRFPKGWCNAV